MGVTFRSGGYIKHVRFGGRTIKDGEAAAIWDANGTHTQIIGPKRAWLINSTIRFLTRYKAESHQYLKVSHRDGRIEHIHGPAAIYANPAYHDTVSVEDGLRLCSDSECVVTFSSPSERTMITSSTTNLHGGFDTQTVKDSEATKLLEQEEIDKFEKGEHEIKLSVSSSSSSSSSVKQTQKKTEGPLSKSKPRIIYGPTLFIPQPSENVHTFSWSDLHSNSRSLSHEVVGKHDFQILHTKNNTLFQLTIPTLDGFTFDASLVLSYNAASIDNLIKSKDPIKELYNGICFDSQTLGDAIPSTLLKSKKEDVVAVLSQIQSYPSLIHAANKCGLNLESIQITSICLCASLCAQIDEEQKLAADIQSEIAKMTHSCKLRQMEMEAQQKRIKEEAELKKKEVKTKNDLDMESHKFKLAAVEQKIELEKFEAEGKRDVMKVKEDSILDFLTKMKEIGVDMTKFMTTYGGIAMAETVVGRSDIIVKKKLVEIDSGGGYSKL